MDEKQKKHKVIREQQKFEFFKPSFEVANNVPLNSSQHDFYNFLLKKAYEQLEDNYITDTFFLSYTEIKAFNSRLKSEKMILEFFKELYDKNFKFNILGKDSTIEKRIEARFITLISKNSKNETIEFGINPITVGIYRKMIMEKKGISIPSNSMTKELETTKKEGKKSSYVKLHMIKQVTFRPSKVVYELVHDHKNFLKRIPIDEFKEITNTTDKYVDTYNSKVIKKINKDLSPIIENFDIKLIKEGRVNRWVEIKSFYSNTTTMTFEEYYNMVLKNGNMADTSELKAQIRKVYNTIPGRKQ